MLSNSFKSYNFNRQAIDMQDSAALALREFENKTRGAEQLLIENRDELAYYAYIAGNVRPAPSKIRFVSENNILKREIYYPQGTGPTYAYPETPDDVKVIATGVINSDNLFSYYSAENYNYSNDSITKLPFPVEVSKIKMIRIDLEIDFDIAKPPAASHETTMVNLRNLKRNL